MRPVALVVVLIFSIVVHEVAHAWQARREGDDTAEKLGRITLNPIPHLDPLGSFLVPLAFYLVGPGNLLFGWAKPVPVDPRNYRSYVAGDIRVSLAGIVANLAVAVLCVLALVVVEKLIVTSGGAGPVLGLLDYALWAGLTINLILAFFNLIPIPPLDGSHVVAHLLPAELALHYRRAGQYGILVLILVLYLFDGALDFVFGPVLFLQGLADQFIRLWM